MLINRFWTSHENLDGPSSDNLVGKLKFGGNLFFESSMPVNRENINDILFTLLDYPQLRFVKITSPNLKKGFNSTLEAEEYLKRLVNR